MAAARGPLALAAQVKTNRRLLGLVDVSFCKEKVQGKRRRPARTAGGRSCTGGTLRGSKGVRVGAFHPTSPLEK